jgi:protein-arginine kinase activator protein McsA
MTLHDAKEILEDIKSLKIKLVKAQDFDNAAKMRDMEKEYLDKEFMP